MTHPIIDAAAAACTATESVADTNPAFMTPAEKAEALLSLTRAEARLAELRLRILADSDDLAATTAAHDIAGWLTTHTRVHHESARADLRLARALDRRYAVLAAALRAGDVTLAQAHVVARALEALPTEVPAEMLVRAEETLVAHCSSFGPRELGRLGRRILQVVAPEIAEEAEARRLAQLEEDARLRTRLMMRRCGDGTTRLSALLPDRIATRLATYLESFTNPRVAESAPDADVAGRDPVARLAYPRKLGEAFCALLEVVDPSRLPVHGGDATTVVVTIDLAALKEDLATADVLAGGHVPGESPTGDGLTAADVRRLACSAHILPAVLDGQGVPLDLGRAQRLFTPAQRKALLLRDRECRAEGCTQPGRWAEAHHLDPWSHGGRTDLANAVLLCRHHHHRIHDAAYETRRLPNGDLRFHRRT